MTGKVKVRICFASLICVVMILLASCDFRLMSKREVEEYLEKQYNQEFTVLSSKSITDGYYDDDVWRVKAYTVSPKDDPDTCFYAFNIVEGESFGVFGFRNSLHDTYALDIFRKAFETRVADTDVRYSIDYFYPVKSSSVYYSSLYVDIEPVCSENLEAVCEVLSLAFTDTLEKIPEVHESLIGVTIWVRYRETEWPEEKTCVIRMNPFFDHYWNEETSKYEIKAMDTDAAAIQKYILYEAAKD